MEEIMQRMNDRDAVIFERINSLEQNSSRGSQSSGTSIVAATPGENGLGVIPDRMEEIQSRTCQQPQEILQAILT